MDRRQFIGVAGSGAAGSLLYKGLWVTPAQAAARQLPLRLLTAAEAAGFGTLAQTLVPGAVTAGIVHFLDYQLSLPPNDCMLIAKYFNVKPPYVDFYREGLRALNAHCDHQYKKGVDRLTSSELHEAASTIGKGNPPGWDGPPAPLWYLLLRSDAVDLVYGTPEGLQKLGLPYMAHIEPPKAWP